MKLATVLALLAVVIVFCASEVLAQSDHEQRAQEHRQEFDQRMREHRQRVQSMQSRSRPSSRASQWNQGSFQPAKNTVQYYGAQPQAAVTSSNNGTNRGQAAGGRLTSRPFVANPVTPAARSTATTRPTAATVAKPAVATKPATVPKKTGFSTKYRGTKSAVVAGTVGAASSYAANFTQKTNLDAMPYSPPKNKDWFDWNQFYRATINGGIIGGLAGALVYGLFFLSKSFGVTPSPAMYKGGTFMALAITIPLASSSIKLPFINDMLNQMLPSTKVETKPEAAATKPGEYWAPIEKCEINFPSTIRKDKMGAFGVNLDTFTHETPDGALILSYGIMPKIPAPVYSLAGARQSDVQQQLDGAAKGAMQGMHAVSSNIRPYESNGYAGRDVDGTLPDKKGLARMRIFMAHDRIYQILVIGRPDFTRSERSTKFLNSFKLLD